MQVRVAVIEVFHEATPMHMLAQVAGDGKQTVPDMLRIWDGVNTRQAKATDSLANEGCSPHRCDELPQTLGIFSVVETFSHMADQLVIALMFSVHGNAIFRQRVSTCLSVIPCLDKPIVL